MRQARLSPRFHTRSSPLWRWLWLPLLGLLLGGCGFHMRGGELLPTQLHQLHLVGDSRSDLYRLVATRLKRARIDLVAGGEKVPQLTLGGINVVNQVVSVDSRRLVGAAVSRLFSRVSIADVMDLSSDTVDAIAMLRSSSRASRSIAPASRSSSVRMPSIDACTVANDGSIVSSRGFAKQWC